MSMGSLFDNYDPTGALNGMFAPAFIKGFAPSEKAVGDWNAANAGLTSADIDATRMPASWQAPTTNQYGTPNVSLGDPRGTVDPEALRVAAQGGHYDKEARRNAIASQIATNLAAQQNYSTSDPYALMMDERRARLPMNMLMGRR